MWFYFYIYILFFAHYLFAFCFIIKKKTVKTVYEVERKKNVYTAYECWLIATKTFVIWRLDCVSVRHTARVSKIGTNDTKCVRKWYYLPATKRKKKKKPTTCRMWRKRRYQPFNTRPSNSVAISQEKEKKPSKISTWMRTRTHIHSTNIHKHTHIQAHHDRTELREILLEVINLLKANQDKTN